MSAELVPACLRGAGSGRDKFCRQAAGEAAEHGRRVPFCLNITNRMHAPYKIYSMHYGLYNLILFFFFSLVNCNAQKAVKGEQQLKRECLFGAEFKEKMCPLDL